MPDIKFTFEQVPHGDAPGKICYPPAVLRAAWGTVKPDAQERLSLRAVCTAPLRPPTDWRQRLYAVHVMVAHLNPGLCERIIDRVCARTGAPRPELSSPDALLELCNGRVRDASHRLHEARALVLDYAAVLGDIDLQSPQTSPTKES